MSHRYLQQYECGAGKDIWKEYERVFMLVLLNCVTERKVKVFLLKARPSVRPSTKAQSHVTSHRQCYLCLLPIFAPQICSIATVNGPYKFIQRLTVQLVKSLKLSTMTPPAGDAQTTCVCVCVCALRRRCVCCSPVRSVSVLPAYYKWLGNWLRTCLYMSSLLSRLDSDSLPSFLFIDIPRSHAGTPHSSGRVVSPSLRPLPTQHATKAKDEHPFPQRESNPQSQQASGLRARGHRDRPLWSLLPIDCTISFTASWCFDCKLQGATSVEDMYSCQT